MQLNRAKCRTDYLEDVKRGRLEMLGTCIGSAGARTDFLRSKIDAQLCKLHNLRDLPPQHALLLLRQ